MLSVVSVVTNKLSAKTTKMDSLLIAVIKRYPQLYDKRNSMYKNSQAVDNGWTAVAAELKTTSK